MSDLTHVGPGGEARMVDVSGKPITARFARASGSIRMRPETLELIRKNELGKGDVLAVARVAGIMAAKRTAELIPLCHPIPLTDVQVTLALDDTLPGIRVEAAAKTNSQTGVEMEAITAVSVTLITVYDMAKGVDRAMLIGEISLIEKAGGLGGDYRRDG
jgi:cyclic pyranopterin monophosphate synthase